jgi:hypothetical protein
VVHAGPFADPDVRRLGVPQQFPGDEFPDLPAIEVPPVHIDAKPQVGPLCRGELADDDAGAEQAKLLGDFEPEPSVENLAVLGLDDRDDHAPAQDVLGESSA